MEREIIDLFQRFCRPKLIYIFGSFYKEHFSTESDVDIAYLLSDRGKFKTGKTNLELLLRLQDLLQRPVDLIDLRMVGHVLQKEVITKGKNIYTISREFQESYEYKQIAMYGQYMEDVAIIRKKILKTGRVYA